MGSCQSVPTADASTARDNAPVAAKSAASAESKSPASVYEAIPADALEVARKVLFTEARTHHGFETDREISDETLKRVYDLYKWGPTSMNTSPVRIVWLRTPEAKAKLVPALMAGNVQQTNEATVTAIVAYDTNFVDKLDHLSPNYDAAGVFAKNPGYITPTAILNSTLQGGYFILAARAEGLDVGPMSGFDEDKLNSIFFEGTTWKVNFLCNIGYGKPEKLHPRAPRLDFKDAVEIL